MLAETAQDCDEPHLVQNLSGPSRDEPQFRQNITDPLSQIPLEQWSGACRKKGRNSLAQQNICRSEGTNWESAKLLVAGRSLLS